MSLTNCSFVPLLHCRFLVYTDETQLKHPGNGVKPTGFVCTEDITRAKMRAKRITSNIMPECGDNSIQIGFLFWGSFIENGL